MADLAGSASLVGQQGMGSTVRMTSQARIAVPLDTYATGGFSNFVATTVKGLLGSKITVLDIQQAGPINITTTFYEAYWDRANDKLVIVTGGAQVAGSASLAAITAAEFIVTYV